MTSTARVVKVRVPGMPSRASSLVAVSQVRTTATVPPAWKAVTSTSTSSGSQRTPAADRLSSAVACASTAASVGCWRSDAARAAAAAALVSCAVVSATRPACEVRADRRLPATGACACRRPRPWPAEQLRGGTGTVGSRELGSRRGGGRFRRARQSARRRPKRCRGCEMREDQTRGRAPPASRGGHP